MASQNKQSTITNGVVITVYVESSRTRSIKPLEDSTKKTKPHPRFRRPQTTTGTQGYDRRAQLLAYSRQLRENAIRSQKNYQVQLPRNHSRPRSKNRLLLAEPIRMCSPSTQMAPTSNECVEHKGGEEIKGSKKNKGSANKRYPVLRKLKNMLKTLSCKEIEL
ncbi:uncharacterized protein LOC114916938 [Cajanus cajan]|uniref:uncharacterized protein LOC114916938 n=1 Tax=Cajanus cajan TaxID=3821 RepID=UPI0010FB70E1|nr:uncharacterized protein LOC114916938 [Cajanus cajan]